MLSDDKLLKDLTVGEFKQYMEQLIEDILSKRISYPQPYPVSPIYGPGQPPYKYDVYCQGDINGTDNKWRTKRIK